MIAVVFAFFVKINWHLQNRNYPTKDETEMEKGSVIATFHRSDCLFTLLSMSSFIFFFHFLSAYTGRFVKCTNGTVVLVAIQISELFIVHHLRCLKVQAITGLTACAEIGGHL